MATSPTQAPRTVECYHCRKGFDVPRAAMSISCPWCYKRVTLDDLIVKGTCWTSRVQTCGRLVIEKKGVLVASYIEARCGMTIDGAAEGNLISGGPVVLGPKAHVKGDLEAPSIDVAKGAIIEGGFFKIVTARPKSGIKHAGFARPPSPSQRNGKEGLQVPTIAPRTGEVKSVVRVPEWVQRSLRATS